MKRNLKFFLALAAAAGLTACSGAKTTSPAPETTVAETTVAETKAAESNEAAQEAEGDASAKASDILTIAEQGIFSSGGTVTDPLPGD